MLIKLSYHWIFIISYYLYPWNLAESFIFFPTASIIPPPLLSSCSLDLSPSLPYFIFKINFKNCRRSVFLFSVIIQFSCSVMSDSLWPHGLQHARHPCPSPVPSLLRLLSIQSVMPSNHLNLCCPLLLVSSIFPSIRVFLMKVSSMNQVAKEWSLEFQLQHQSFQWMFRIDFL